ncbi:MAG: DUF362 domain-containing protein, partial [Myxococcota bacterium]
MTEDPKDPLMTEDPKDPLMRMGRRRFMKVGLAGAGALAACARGVEPPADRRRPQSRVAVLPASSYEADLRDLLLRGLAFFAPEVQGRRVVLKPNYVEFDPEGAINTHPRMVEAAVLAFLSLGAAEVVVAEGAGHRRDTAYLLGASGLDAVLRERRVRFVDLNIDRVAEVTLPTSFTPLGRLWLPRTVLDADLFVSLPKLKMHHWAGVTLSMKNLFGIVPGAIYGWPKNVLHQVGIPNSIVDINAALEMPRLAIVDGVVGMEGNGPIQGEPRVAGVVLIGDDFPAVDATGARIMGAEAERVDHLRWAGEFL